MDAWRRRHMTKEARRARLAGLVPGAALQQVGSVMYHPSRTTSAGTGTSGTMQRSAAHRRGRSGHRRGSDRRGEDPMSPDALKTIRMQIMGNRLIAVVEEQAQALVRTAFSPIVREAGDLSAGVSDTRGRMLAQAVTGTPGHVNSMAESAAIPADAHGRCVRGLGGVVFRRDPMQGAHDPRTVSCAVSMAATLSPEVPARRTPDQGADLVKCHAPPPTSPVRRGPCTASPSR